MGVFNWESFIRLNKSFDNFSFHTVIIQRTLTLKHILYFQVRYCCCGDPRVRLYFITRMFGRVRSGRVGYGGDFQLTALSTTYITLILYNSIMLLVMPFDRDKSRSSCNNNNIMYIMVIGNAPNMITLSRYTPCRVMVMAILSTLLYSVFSLVPYFCVKRYTILYNVHYDMLTSIPFATRDLNFKRRVEI